MLAIEVTQDIFTSAILSTFQIILQVSVKDVEIPILADSSDLNLYEQMSVQMIEENQTQNTYFEGEKIKIKI